ncbi:MAG: response regulator, partial [Aquificales bacterium]|nr:response regulator [Aquificales bacterium]
MDLDYITYTILIIDDDAPSLKVLMNYLQDLGYKTLVARSGERGWEVARRRVPDLILLDVMMPGIDGFETCRRLKENETTKDIPVIFLTALPSTSDKIKGFEAGAVDYITKPIQNQEVSIRIHTHLRLRELTENLEKKVQEQTKELVAEIAERKQAETLLRESEEKYRRLVEAANVAIFVAQDGIFKLFNSKTLEISGYSRPELAVQPFAELIHPEDREVVVSRHLQRLRGEQPDDVYVF